ncbi:MAG: hypothetical protein R3C44_13330 [Chloroflexota bacterium]
MIPAIHHRGRQSTWWLRVSAVLLVIGAVGLFSLIAIGVFDPQPVGPRTADFFLYTVPISSQDEVIDWIDNNPVRHPRTWQLDAAFSSGEPDSGYGLAVGDDDRMLVVGVSPLGYAAVWEQTAGGDETAVWFPWQPWPHVGTDTTPNEIWLDVVPEGDRDRLTVRINRELLWSGQVEALGGSAGIWLASFGDDDAFVDFRQLTRFDAPPTADGED